MKKQYRYHTPAMVNEVLRYLNAHSNMRVIDATAGYAGHMIELLKHGVRVLGVEADPETLETAEASLESTGTNDSKVVLGNFRDIDQIAKENGFAEVDGILFDLGINTKQLTSTQRGMSFNHPDAVLDMRIDRSNESPRACDLLNILREDQLAKLFEENGVYRPRTLARRIVERRQYKQFHTVGDLLEITNGFETISKKINPVTKVFMALRIAVNSELENLTEALPKAFGMLRRYGRLIVISFHSGEDKIVKDFFVSIEQAGKGLIITKKPLKPTFEEINANPRVRSAKLRVLEKQ